MKVSTKCEVLSENDLLQWITIFIIGCKCVVRRQLYICVIKLGCVFSYIIFQNGQFKRIFEELLRQHRVNLENMSMFHFLITIRANNILASNLLYTFTGNYCATFCNSNSSHSIE